MFVVLLQDFLCVHGPFIEDFLFVHGPFTEDFLHVHGPFRSLSLCSWSF